MEAQVNQVSSQIVASSYNTTGITFSTNNPNPGITTYNWTNNNPMIGLQPTGTANINYQTEIVLPVINRNTFIKLIVRFNNNLGDKLFVENVKLIK